MIHHSTSRNRSKGFKIKQTIQVALFLAVALWLVYQVKHSYDKKTEDAINDQRVSAGASDIYWGRKGQPGNDNIIAIDSDGSDPAKQNERKDIGQGEDDTNSHLEVDTKEEVSDKRSDDSKIPNSEGNNEEEASNKKSQEHQENSADNAEKQILPEKQVHSVGGDSDAKSKDETKNDMKGVKEEVLQLPSQIDGEQSGQIDDGKGETNSIEQADSNRNKQIKLNTDSSGKAGDNGDSGTEESSNSSLDTQTSEGDATGWQKGTDSRQTSDDVTGSQEGNDYRKVEDATNSNDQADSNPNNQVKLNADSSGKAGDQGNNGDSGTEKSSNVSLDTQTSEGDATGSLEGTDSRQASEGDATGSQESNDNRKVEDATNDSKQEAKNANSISDKNASSTDDETINKDNAEPQSDGASDTKNSDNQTTKVANTDSKSEDDLPDLSKANPENNRVMPTNYEASIKDSFETEGDNASQVETTGKNSSEETKAERPDENPSSTDTQKNSDVPITDKNAVDSQDSSTSTAENQDKENSKEDGSGSQMNNIPDTEIKQRNEIDSQLSNSNGPSSANSNTETVQEGGNSAALSSSAEVPHPDKLKVPKTTQKDRKKQKRHKRKEEF